jgi:uncharacterized membrane protein
MKVRLISIIIATLAGVILLSLMESVAWIICIGWLTVLLQIWLLSGLIRGADENKG